MKTIRPANLKPRGFSCQQPMEAKITPPNKAAIPIIVVAWKEQEEIYDNLEIITFITCSLTIETILRKCDRFNTLMW